MNTGLDFIIFMCHKNVTFLNDCSFHFFQSFKNVKPFLVLEPYKQRLWTRFFDPLALFY